MQKTNAAEPQGNIARTEDYSLAHSDETRMSILENRLSGLDGVSLGSDTTIGQHTLLRHELNQKELDVYMLNTRLTWHEKILNERDAMITRKTDEIEELKKKMQHQSSLVHTLETQLHQEKSKNQSLTTQKAHLKTLHEELKLRGKEDREQNRKLQRRIGELEDSTRSQLLNRSITHNEDSLKDLERNLSSEMKSIISQMTRSFETQQSAVLQEVRNQNQASGRVEKLQKENSQLATQIQELKQTIQKMTWKLETYTEKYQKMKDENERLQKLYDSSLSQILANQEDLVLSMKKQSEQLGNGLYQMNRSSEEIPVNQPIVLALGKMEQLLETLETTSLTKPDLQTMLREIENVQATVSVTPKILKDMMDSLRETRMELDSKLGRNSSENSTLALQSSVERIQDQMRHLEQMLTQKVDQQTGDILAKVGNMQPVQPSERGVSTEFLDAKITAEMQRLNLTVDKSLKHSVDKLYDTLKQSFDVLAKNIHEMTCGETSLANRSGANEVEDTLHRISSSIDEINLKLSTQHHSRNPETISNEFLSEFSESLISAMNSKEIVTNQDILLTQINDLREQLTLYSKNCDDGFSFFHQHVVSKSDMNDLISHIFTSEQASNLHQSANQQMQQYLNVIHQDLKSLLQEASLQGNHFDPLRRGSIELPEVKNAKESNPVLEKLQDLKLRIDDIPKETEDALKAILESNMEIQALGPKKIVDYFDAKLVELKNLIESRRISREPFSPRIENDSDEIKLKEKAEFDLNKSMESDCQDSQEIVESKRESLQNTMREFRVVMDEMNSFITTGRQSLPEIESHTRSLLEGISTIYKQLNTDKSSLNTFNEVQNLHSKLESHLVPLFKYFIQSNSPNTLKEALLFWSGDILKSQQELMPQPIMADSQIEKITDSVEKTMRDLRDKDMKIPELMHEDINSFHQNVATLQKEIGDVQKLDLPSLVQRFLK